MRVLVLGGAGVICSETTCDLAQFSDFKEIVVADNNLEAVTRLVESIGDPRLEPLFFSADDYPAMLRLFPRFTWW